MPRPSGRGINLKFNKQGKFDPMATVGKTSKQRALTKYLATTKGERRQQAKAYRSWKFNKSNAARRAENEDTATQSESTSSKQF